MKLALTLVSIVALIGITGCYKTEIRAPGAQATGPTHEDRQWFTLAGMLNISGEAGAECGSEGVAYASSRHGFWDIVIDAGISIAAGAIGTQACDRYDDREEYASCVSGFSAAGPLLLSARSVTYRCRGFGGTGDKLPLVPSVASAEETKDERD